MKKLICAALVLMSLSAAASAQTIYPLLNKNPQAGGVAFVLTDGTVLTQGSASDWWKLTPDINGSYLRGTWSQVASLPYGYDPLYFASAVLADGRLIIAGGEYNRSKFALSNRWDVYDPKKDTWAGLTLPPLGWSTIGDSQSVVLPDGSFLLAQKLTEAIARFDPKTMTWTAMQSTGKHGFNSEEGWTLMPDGTVLTADVKGAPNSEIYNPSRQAWTSAGSTIVDLHSPTTVVGCIPYPGGCYYPPGEIGPQMLRPDGTVFVTGGIPKGGTSAHTSIYHPTTRSWTVGPDFPNGDDSGDSGAVLLPNGNVLVGGTSGALYEFDGSKLSMTASSVASGHSYPMLILPSGQVLLQSQNGLSLYNPTGTAQADWAPRIGTVPTSLTRGGTYTISGNRFNGMSQAAAFGDELETATNYPLVRITNNATKHVVYARTHDHSTMGVATGNAVVTTNFDVPPGTETGASTLQVVANGVPSGRISVTVN